MVQHPYAYTDDIVHGISSVHDGRRVEQYFDYDIQFVLQILSSSQVVCHPRLKAQRNLALQSQANLCIACSSVWTVESEH